jgi:raffinose/stachyose/melibiose transport system permease protein
VGLFRYTWRSFGRELILLAVAAVVFFPIYLVVALAFGPANTAYLHPLGPPRHLTFGGLTTAWQGINGVTIGKGLINSAIITVSTVVILLIIGSLCAYVLARRISKLSTLLYLLCVSGLIIPFQLGIIPVYEAMRQVHLVGTFLGMILLEVAFLLPLTVFFYTGFIRQLPRDYEEAAYVDGASLLYTFTRVVFPLLRPATGTVAVLAAVVCWNDFFAPLVFLSGSTKITIPVVVSAMAGEFTAQWGIICAAIVISSLPVIVFFLIAQRQLVRGFGGGLRG